MKRLILPISTFLLFAVGCDNPMLDNAAQLDSPELQDFAKELSSDLGLSESSASAVNDVLNRHGRKGKHREPGFLWKVAGELAVELSDEEKARLFEKMDEKEIPLFGSSKGKKGNKGKSYFNGINKVLTDDQKVTFKVIKVAYKERFKAIHEQVKDGTLSKEDAKAQKDALRDAAHQEARDAAKALFEKSKNGDIDKDTLREGLKNIFAAKNEKMLGIFDDSQIEIIKIHKALSLRMKKHKGKKGGKRGGSKRG